MIHTFVSVLDTLIDKYDLLKHPFYLRWNMGELTESELRVYACEYFHFVRAIPTYVSAIHSNCREHSLRLSILENLVEKETGGEGLIPHEEQWVWYSRGIGISRDELYGHSPAVATRKLLLTYRNLCNSSNCVVGAAAMYAYESRIPDIAIAKLQDLDRHYDIHDEVTLRLFRELMAADIEHSKTWSDLIARMACSDDCCRQIEESASKAARALWRMLDGVCEQCDIRVSN